MPTLVLNSEQVEFLDRELVCRRPERLVHVVGEEVLPGRFRVRALVLDETAEASGAHCRATSTGESAIHESEESHGGRYIGVIHSHPLGVPEPSGQDAVAARDALSLNPRLGTFFVGVVTAAQDVDRFEHRLAIGRGQLALHAAMRDDKSFRPTVPRVGGAEFLDALAARNPMEAVTCLAPRKITIFGCGSLGSVIGEALARNGVSQFRLVDPDSVEAANLSRSIYTTADIATPKAEALANRLRAINPLVVVETANLVVGDDALATCEGLVSWADVVVAVTDDPRGQAIIDELTTRAEKPTIFAGVLPGGHIGEIVLCAPGLTACYRCAAGNLRLISPNLNRDYSTGRLMGAVGLGADITLLAQCAAKLIINLLGLVFGTDMTLLRPIAEGRTMVQVGLTPNAFDKIIPNSPHQHIFQSVWMAPTPSPGCPCHLNVTDRGSRKHGRSHSRMAVNRVAVRELDPKISSHAKRRWSRSASLARRTRSASTQGPVALD